MENEYQTESKSRKIIFLQDKYVMASAHRIYVISPVVKQFRLYTSSTTEYNVSANERDLELNEL